MLVYSTKYPREHDAVYHARGNVCALCVCVCMFAYIVEVMFFVCSNDMQNAHTIHLFVLRFVVAADGCCVFFFFFLCCTRH